MNFTISNFNNSQKIRASLSQSLYREKVYKLPEIMQNNDISEKVYFRSQIVVCKYRSILEREIVPVSVDTSTSQYR